jgi:hypothetical protein
MARLFVMTGGVIGHCLLIIYTLKTIKMKNNKKIQVNQTAGKQHKSASENDDREELKSKKGDSDSDLDSDHTRERSGKAAKI